MSSGRLGALGLMLLGLVPAVAAARPAAPSSGAPGRGAGLFAQVSWPSHEAAGDHDEDGDDDDPPAKKQAEPRRSRDHAKDRDQAEDGADDRGGEKDQRAYAKPEPFALPEGPARSLSGPILVVDFDATVDPGTGEYVISTIDRASREGAQAVLIELNTPGGMVSTTEKIVRAMLRSPVPVVVFVAPSGAHAASAGTFITLAGHVAAMAPATRLGAAHPVAGSGKDVEAEGGKHMGRKVENDVVAFVEGISKERHRNVDWAIDAVRRSVAINADRALELGVIDLIARDRADLLDKLEGRQLVVGAEKVELHTRGARVVEVRPSLRAWLLDLLASPGIAMILGILGTIGILVEIYHPGMIAPGVMGVLCFICSLIAMEGLPINVGAAILVLAGLGLLIAEIHASTYGVLAVLGTIALSVGLVLLIDVGRPGYLVDESFALRPADVLPMVAILLAFILYLSLVVVRSRRKRPVTGSEGLVGQTGRVLKEVGPDGGSVFVAGTYWRARSPEVIHQEEEIEVVKVTGLELEVRRKRPT